MAVQFAPLDFAVLGLEFGEVVGEALDLSGLEEADEFEVGTHGARGVVGQSRYHGFADVVGVVGVQHVPETFRLAALSTHNQ